MALPICTNPADLKDVLAQELGYVDEPVLGQGFYSKFIFLFLPI